jgi:hypothetical protein
MQTEVKYAKQHTRPHSSAISLPPSNAVHTKPPNSRPSIDLRQSSQIMHRKHDRRPHHVSALVAEASQEKDRETNDAGFVYCGKESRVREVVSHLTESSLESCDGLDFIAASRSGNTFRATVDPAKAIALLGLGFVGRFVGVVGFSSCATGSNRWATDDSPKVIAHQKFGLVGVFVAGVVQNAMLLIHSETDRGYGPHDMR